MSETSLHLAVSTSTLNLIKIDTLRDVDIYTHLSFTMDNDKHFGKIFSISVLYSIILSNVYIILFNSIIFCVLSC